MTYEVVAKAVFYVEEDETGMPHQATIIKHAGSLWLVATWLKSNDTGMQYPARIVPMAKLRYSDLPDGLVLIETILTTALSDDVCLPELLRKYGVVEYQSLAHIQTRGGIH